MSKVIKGIKLRLYPTKAQQDQLWQMFGNDRKVWNLMLGMAKERYENNPSSHFVNEYGMNYLLKRLKQEYPYLKDSDATSFLVVNHNLAQSFKMLFKHRGGYPRFKSCHAWRQSYTGRSACKVTAKRRMQLPKLGSIRTSKTGQLTNCRIKEYTLSYDMTGRYYLSLSVESLDPKPLPKTGKVVGIDLGLCDLAIQSDGKKIPAFVAGRSESQARHWQQLFNRRKHQTTVKVRQWNYNHSHLPEMQVADERGWQKAQRLKARWQCKIANQRKDYLQKLTTQLVQAYDTIVIEDLQINHMQKNHKLARSIANASWYALRTMLAYKCNWYGKRLIIVSPNYTSQICFNCGYRSGKKPLDVRHWTCPKCHARHDRDVNAANNILTKGLNQSAQLSGLGRTLVR